MASESKKKSSRKRTAEQAEIDTAINPNGTKKFKLSPAPKEKEDEIVNDAFSKYTNPSLGFSTLLNTNSSNSNQETLPTSDTANLCINDTQTDIIDTNNFNSFDSFASFKSFDSDKKTESDFSGWPNAKKLNFSFDDNCSKTFSLNELEKNDDDKKENQAQISKKEIPKETEKEINFGDDSDETIFSLRCKVFELSKDRKNWTEKGVGTVKLNTFMIEDKESETQKEKLRILCRREIVENTIINGMVHKTTKFIKRNENSVQFVLTVCKNDVENDDIVTETKSYLLRSKESDKTKLETFLQKIEEIQEKM